MTLSDDEKREFARLLLPAWAYDLTRTEILEFNPGENCTGAALDILLEQLLLHVRRRARRGERFALALIPSREPRESRSRSDP